MEAPNTPDSEYELEFEGVYSESDSEIMITQSSSV